ncbi:MAG: hypothetical protein ACRCZ9_08900 [Fusobacteriaceae bacterium]
MSRREIFKKRVSLGYMCFIKEEEIKEFLFSYKDLIKYIYFSPPLGDMYLSRRIMSDMYSEKTNIEKMVRVLKYCNEIGIGLELALNSSNTPKLLTSNSVQDSKEWLESNNIVIDRVVCVPHLIGLVKEKFGNIFCNCSYNSRVRNIKDINSMMNIGFDGIVIGNTLIRDMEAYTIIKTHNLESTLLTNNGCNHGCVGCGTGKRANCVVFDYICGFKYGIDKVYAMSSVVPYEIMNLYEPSGLIDVYKISSRTIRDISILVGVMEGYFVRDNDKFYTDLNTHNIKNWSMLSRVTNTHYDITKIMKYKKEMIDVELIKLKNRKTCVSK